jgi:hypothetical protein
MGCTVVILRLSGDRGITRSSPSIQRMKINIHKNKWFRILPAEVPRYIKVPFNLKALR